MSSSIQRKISDDPSLERFLGFCHRRKYPKKAQVFSPGDAADVLYYIIEGSVAVYLEDEESNEIILAYLNAGEFIGEMGMFVEQPERGVTVMTRTECILAEISYSRLQKLFEGPLHNDHADILRLLGIQLSRRLMQASRQVGRLAFLDTSGRIARALLDLCKEPDAMTHPDGMQIKVTRQEISRIVGCSREMVGRVLKVLEQQGLVSVSGKTIVVYGTR